MVLQVLFVEDDSDTLKQYETYLPEVFQKNGVDVKIHPCGNFDDALKLAASPLQRYDMIISDTYKGPTKNGDAEVLNLVGAYRGPRFCPLVLYSSGVKPPTLVDSPFVVWADKAKPNDIERAVKEVLKTGVPQIARKLHDEIEASEASFLWKFLEDNWAAIWKATGGDERGIERLIRRRVAIQIGDLDQDGEGLVPVPKRLGSEYYVYPRLPLTYYNLGDILRAKQDQNDFRVILTPHCHLFTQPNHTCPRADYVLTVKTLPAGEILGEKIANAKKLSQREDRHKKLGRWTRSPAQTGGTPDGRHWYLPSFLDIPHLFCDLLQIESVPYSKVGEDFDAIATLVPPYAEALQACFVNFYGSVGIPDLRIESIEDMLD